MKLLATLLVVGTYASAVAAPLEGFRQTLADLIRVDTTNPPGNEARAVHVVAERLKAESVPYEVVEFAPGRASLVARLKATGTPAGKPLLLLAHLDVVGARNQPWTSDPHVLIEKDGYLQGRGVADDLGMAVLELEVFLALKRAGTPLRRDVILALTGDEESGGGGIRYLLAHRPELVDAAIALNEGGGPILGDDGQVKLVTLQSAEKSYEDFRLVAKGPTGHSSVPHADNAIYRLARALDRLGRAPMPVRLSPLTRTYLERRARLEPPALAKAMRALAAAKGAPPPWARKELEKNPAHAIVLRTTCVATMVSGGIKENALPSEARANINCRILPDETVDIVRARLSAAIADPAVAIERVADFGVAGASPLDGELPVAVEKLVRKRWPGAPVLPTMSALATDSRFLRQRGVAAYGLNPIAMSEAEARRWHGVDERIPVSSLEPAMAFLHDLVFELAAKPVL